MQSGQRGMVSVDTTPLALTVALLVRDAAGLPVLNGLPARTMLPVADMELSLTVGAPAWRAWWNTLLADVQANQVSPLHAAAPEEVRPLIDPALQAYAP